MSERCNLALVERWMDEQMDTSDMLSLAQNRILISIHMHSHGIHYENLNIKMNM